MKSFSLLLLSLLFSGLSYTQCLTDFTKLVPEPSIDAVTGFGSAVSMYDNYLAVGIPFNDSLGRVTGVVEIYELTSNAWKKVATMAPSDPVDGMRFGTTVKLTKDYLLVGAMREGGKVYLFKKNVGGWSNSMELTAFSYPVSSYYGIHSNRSITMSDDQQTIAIADPFYRNASMPFSRSGAIFIYHKSNLSEWNGAIAPEVLLSPEDDCQDFGTAGIQILGNRIITATPFAPTGIGRVYVYKDASPDFSNPVLEAKLDPGNPAVFDAFLFGSVSLVCNTDGIFVTGVTGLQTNGKFGILYFQMPASGNWIDTQTPTCYFEPKIDGTTNNQLPFNILSNGSEIFATVKDDTGKGYLHVIKKGPAGWCSPQYELIDDANQEDTPFLNSYGQAIAVNQTGTKAAIGFVAHPESQSSLVAIKAFEKKGTVWEPQTLYSKKKTTAGHFYGRNILGFDNYMFVAAPFDGTAKPKAGAVYCYKKVGSTWQKTGKILPPVSNNPYDDVFGSALASNKTYLAVGASGHEPKGKIFMYKKSGIDWSSVELVQEVTIPEEGLTVYAYGDNVAMDEDWLIIPYVQNSPARIILAIFKFNGTTWDFKQTADVGFANIMSKETTLAVAIENGIMVAGGNILELNKNDEWEFKYVLSPSDPEFMQISPDFSYWVSNGSMFGYSVAIHDNTIFIGAPSRDYNDIWDVGAVYVYTKEPNEPWSSRTETIKLVPRVKEENELFGYSLSALYNTLIVGAPGSDFYKNNAPRNKPGRAYVFQAEDYLWENVTALIDFTGDSFTKDYYGISVYVDQTDFMIGASIEDIATGKISGAVYVTPTPPIVKLMPPACQGGLIDLFGYPFGGTWAGPGLVDAKEGIFNTDIIGTGVKTFTYETESCAYTGKLQIRIEPPVRAILDGAEQQYVCIGSAVNKVIGIIPQDGCSYEWYYRADASKPFEIIEGNTASITITKRGDYQVKVYNRVCQTFSPVVSVLEQSIDLTLTPVKPACNDKSVFIDLTASPIGGQWSGPGVNNNLFNPDLLAAGVYTLSYSFKSPEGCVFQNSIQVQVEQPFNTVIKNLEGDLCKEGNVTLGIQGNVPDGMKITWYKFDSQSNQYAIAEEDKIQILVTEKGIYKAEVGNQVCNGLSEPITVNADLKISLTPEENKKEICSDEIYTLTFAETPGATFQWYYASGEGEIPQLLNVSERELKVDQTGYYMGVASRGVCRFESEPKYILVLPAEETLIPDVITPNGDGYNETFQVVSNQDIETIDIYNRYGKNIFSGSGSSKWDGHNFESGVYYWYVTYTNCKNEKITSKGWVHLVR